MNRLPRWRPRLALFVAIWGLAAAGIFTPAKYTDPVRTAMIDALGPGQTAAVTVTDVARNTLARFRAPVTDNKLTAALAQVDVLQSRQRQQWANSISAIQQISAMAVVGPPLPSATEYDPLLSAGLVPARILGRDPDVLRRRFGRIISRGSSSEIAIEDFVLANLPHLDQGADAGIEAGQPAISGRVVIGRVEQVGRWTSTLQLVTDPDYRGPALIVRPSRTRPVLGPSGVIQGNGDGTCQLKLVPKEQPVSIGDYVYSRQLEADQPAPVYYGRVVEAEPGADQWSVIVEPAFDPTLLSDVQVLKVSLSAQRVTEHPHPTEIALEGPAVPH
jgi:rod shape-determining protein MreC